MESSVPMMIPATVKEVIIDDADSLASGEYSLSTDENETSSTSSSRRESESGGTTSKDEYTPEALVRKENRAVRITRLLLILVLVGATAATGYFVYRFTHESEKESFDDAFENVATKLTSALVSDTSLKFWMARTVSDATAMMLKAMNATALNLFIPQDDWESISREARFHGNVNLASWNPLLKSEEERLQFEEFAQTHVFTVGSEPQCFVCGSEDRGFKNPDQLVDIPGFGTFMCALIENSGRQGVIPDDNCQFITDVSLKGGCECYDLPPGTVTLDNKVEIPERIFSIDPETGESVDEPAENAPYLPTWTSSVLEIVQLPLLYNHMAEPSWKRAIDAMLESTLPVISETFYRTGPYYTNYAAYPNETSTILYFPVLLEKEVVGSISFEVRWSKFLSAVFPPLSDLVDIVIENTCGQNFTFTVDAEADIMVLKGEGDLHDPTFGQSHSYSSTFEEYDLVITGAAAELPPEGAELNYCRYRFHVFATQQFEDVYVTDEPIIFAIVTSSVVVFTSLVFLLYDMMVTRRQRKVMESANRTNAIVSSLFPKNVRDRLLQQAKDDEDGALDLRVSKMRMQTFLVDGNKESAMSSEPIADLFPAATVMFLDIAGFTAWSSERQPSQVFQLLESIYQAFDDIAKKMRVFKVETIGDSYVAVCGLPTPRDDHAPIMVRFADRCLKAMTKVTRDLEVFLGPSTGDLEARVGLHSGPVTAGVLRGEKARFQLFGDTVNTASRIESTGEPGKIHASKATVDLLNEAGKGNWAVKREGQVHLKGKGELETFWVTSIHVSPTQSAASASGRSPALPRSAHVEQPARSIDKKARDLRDRLVDWNVEVLFGHLGQLMAHRVYSKQSRDSGNEFPSVFTVEESIVENRNGKLVIDEMTPTLQMPKFNPHANLRRETNDVPQIEGNVKAELRHFISRIAKSYRDVPFHNFEHVSHVIMSASKLMQRIVNPDGINYDQNAAMVARALHEKTYGISSDPLLQFAAVFSALIHDVEHTGLTNAELNAMDAPLAVQYKKQSAAEQNSVDVAWSILMESKYKNLRACIYTNVSELLHFRNLIVNAVMATDIGDKKLKEYREGRWDVAFPDDDASIKTRKSSGAELTDEDIERSNKKATIVYEYIIQASDVAHTMQHWYTYQKFNTRLFEERYLAWLNGHMEKEPSLGWYGGELWFYDNYIIPLAKKLDKCGVFGVSYHEYLNYAKENRKEWEIKGKEIVAKMKANCDAKYAERLAIKMAEQADVVVMAG